MSHDAWGAICFSAAIIGIGLALSVIVYVAWSGSAKGWKEHYKANYVMFKYEGPASGLAAACSTAK